MNDFDIAIIGAGPSGIMAAISAAAQGARVVLIEKNEKIGRKILATGNGRCNLTNIHIDVSRYHGADSNFVKAVFEQFDQKQTMAFFESIGVILKEEDRGRIFPRTNQATTVVHALKQRLDELRVTLCTNSCVKKIEKKNNWLISLGNDRNVWAKKLILTTGGKAAYQFGSSGDGLFWSKNFKHTIQPIYAALVPVETTETWPKEIQGIKLETRVRVIKNNQIISEKTGDLLFTHYGLSGPAIMGVARDVADNPTFSHLKVDFLPEINEQNLLQKINNLFEDNGSKSIINNLLGFIPKNLLSQLLQIQNINPNKKSAEVDKRQRINIVETLKSLSLHVSKLRPLKEAQVTRGGITTAEVDNKTLESSLVPDLFFAGEILDIDGDSGGFNLQWAWSSGFVSGLHAARKK